MYFGLIQIVILLMTTMQGAWCENCTNHCDRPLFCTEGEFVANPDDCTSYYWCVHSTWELHGCNDNLYFDNLDCVCQQRDLATCVWPCPTTTPRPTYPPAPCDEELTENCEDGKRYPDQADCRYFYECIGGKLGQRTECTSDVINPGSRPSCFENLPCVFDIYQEICVNPDENFDCYYRCITIAPTTSISDYTTAPFTTPSYSTVVEDETTDDQTTKEDEITIGLAVLGAVLVVIAILVVMGTVVMVTLHSFKKNNQIGAIDDNGVDRSEEDKQNIVKTGSMNSSDVV